MQNYTNQLLQEQYDYYHWERDELYHNESLDETSFKEQYTWLTQRMAEIKRAMQSN